MGGGVAEEGWERRKYLRHSHRSRGDGDPDISESSSKSVSSLAGGGQEDGARREEGERDEGRNAIMIEKLRHYRR